MQAVAATHLDISEYQAVSGHQVFQIKNELEKKLISHRTEPH